MRTTVPAATRDSNRGKTNTRTRKRNPEKMHAGSVGSYISDTDTMYDIPVLYCTTRVVCSQKTHAVSLLASETDRSSRTAATVLLARFQMDFVLVATVAPPPTVVCAP